MLAVLAVLAPLDSCKEGRLDEEEVGLIDEGGVMELWEVVSIVEEDLPETASTLDDGLLQSVGDWKLAFDRRRSCLRNGMVTMLELKLGTSRQKKPLGEGEGSSCRNWSWATVQEQEPRPFAANDNAAGVSPQELDDGRIGEILRDRERKIKV